MIALTFNNDKSAAAPGVSSRKSSATLATLLLSSHHPHNVTSGATLPTLASSLSAPIDSLPAFATSWSAADVSHRHQKRPVSGSAAVNNAQTAETAPARGFEAAFPIRWVVAL
jgi:hypothetical protein